MIRVDHYPPPPRPLPPHTYSAYSTCQWNFFAEYGSTSVFWAMRLGYSDINMSTGPGIFIKINKVNGELINIGSCCGPPAMPSRTTRGPRTPGVTRLPYPIEEIKHNLSFFKMMLADIPGSQVQHIPEESTLRQAGR